MRPSAEPREDIAALAQTGLIARGLSKTYGAVRALKDATIEIVPGEVMALIGENGAGKSTLVKILCGIVQPDDGSITINGQVVDVSSPRRAQRQGIAVVQQELGIVDCLSVAENVVLGARQAERMLTRQHLRRQVAPYLAAVGLDYVDPDSAAETLSVAERQLLEVARVAVRRPRIVILDEPTAALAETEIERVHAAVVSLRDSGCGVLYITHRLGEVFALADRVTVMRDGDSLPAMNVAAKTTASLIEAMLGRPLDELYPPRRELGKASAVLEFRGLATRGLRKPLSGYVAKGEIVGFVGQVGSGASAALRGLGGATPSEFVELACNGVSINVSTPRQALRSGIAYCSGDRKLDGIFANRSVEENLTSPSLRKVAVRGWIRKGEEHRRAQALTKLVGVPASRLPTKISTLSGGNQQKIVLGKWLGAAPSVLLIEEPTRGVDVGARAEIYAKLRELAEDGLAIVCASSDSQEIYGLADRIITFFRGGAVGEHRPRDVTHAEIVRDITDPDGDAGADGDNDTA
jgi:ribose transport system ATP-binding protein